MEPRHFRVALYLHRMPQIAIAGINGGCAGAGLGWACACDLRFAARCATFVEKRPASFRRDS